MATPTTTVTKASDYTIKVITSITSSQENILEVDQLLLQRDSLVTAQKASSDQYDSQIATVDALIHEATRVGATSKIGKIKEHLGA
jgi:hypothetical protein